MLDSIILECYNLHCPIITKKISKKDREKPWVTDTLKRLITTRHTYYLWSKNGLISEECYKQFRNHVTYQLIKSSRLFHDFKAYML